LKVSAPGAVRFDSCIVVESRFDLVLGFISLTSVHGFAGTVLSQGRGDLNGCYKDLPFYE